MIKLIDVLQCIGSNDLVCVRISNAEPENAPIATRHNQVEKLSRHLLNCEVLHIDGSVNLNNSKRAVIEVVVYY